MVGSRRGRHGSVNSPEQLETALQENTLTDFITESVANPGSLDRLSKDDLRELLSAALGDKLRLENENSDLKDRIVGLLDELADLRHSNEELVYETQVGQEALIEGLTQHVQHLEDKLSEYE